ncbi:MAG: DUF4251 domain-containing protein [Muribaculaceae bacterium]|nr:DUF4251 domain-containing protein [Muribaculaceae bacterium]
MMRNKIALLLSTVFITVLLMACGTSNGLTKAEREAAITRQVQEGLDTRHYTIAVDWMKPLGGMARHVTSNYELRVNGDEVDSYLPYVGEAYRLPYGGGKGLNFKGKIENYSINYLTSNRSHIEFTANSGEDTYHFRIDVFNNGKSIIDIIAQERDAISFDGEMIF